MRDRLAHRGPDDAGLWMGDGVAMAHRRLSVIDPTPEGHQPMYTPDGRYSLVYNGELYNDAEIREDLEREG
ncbi:MAG: asparagine synthase (glutamine-hydrolyzing), partial [Planctomycetota bacterium]